MTRTDIFKKTGLALAAIAVICAMPVARAMAEKGDLTSVELQSDPIVDIMIGKAEMVTLKGNVSDVLVANPNIVDVMAVKADQLYLVGHALGDTNIMVLDEEGNVLRKINIHVQMDTKNRHAHPKSRLCLPASSQQGTGCGSSAAPQSAPPPPHQ
mgnify:CR=1 FL=1